MTVRQIHSPADLPTRSEGGVAPLAPASWALTQPDAHLVAVDGRQRLVARASVWWREAPHDPEHPEAQTGRIGHLQAASGEAAAQVLGAAVRALRENGCTRAIGPMDGSPWHAYRVVLAPAAASGGAHPSFALEPAPPPATERWLRDAGFETVSTYHSALVDPLPDRADALASKTQIAHASGVTLRAFDPARAESELAALYRISVLSFARNAFYVPIAPEAFLATYRPLVARIDPHLVIVAEREGETVGICFGVPDLAQAARGETVDTVIVKTVAVAPEAAGAGLGGLLVLAVEEAARGLGLSRSIHALMHDGNRSVRISRHGAARVIRRYALLGRAL